ncbi:MAG: SIS domain-containing protein [Promethearchaeota archaeon]
MNEFLEEILSQPQALLDTFIHACEKEQSQFQELKDIYKEKNISKIIFTGMGSSYFSSYLSYYLLNQNGIYSEMREAGEFLLYSFPIIEDNYFKNTAIVLISQSGETGEIVRLLEKINSMKNPPLTIGITNSPESTLALKTNLTFLIKAGKERSITSKSYTCTLLMLHIFAQNLLINFFFIEKNLSEIKYLIKEVKLFLEDFEKIELFINKFLDFFENIEYGIEFLARGPSLATAYQAALNFKEIVKKFSEANSCSTFNHGGIECLNKNSNVVIFSSERNNFKLNIRLIKKMMTCECNKILHVTNQEYTRDDGNLISSSNISKILSFKHNITNPFLAPIMEIIILQLFFYKMAEKRNIIPGKFYFSQKITRDI